MLADRVTILRAPFVTDRYGNETTDRDWGAAVSRPVRGVSVQPATQDEGDGERQVITTGWRLIRRGRLDIEPGDRVIHDGDTYEVKGEAARWSLHGRPHSTVAALERVDG